MLWRKDVLGRVQGGNRSCFIVVTERLSNMGCQTGVLHIVGAIFDIHPTDPSNRVRIRDKVNDTNRTDETFGRNELSNFS